MTIITRRIDCLRQVMYNLHISACVIPSNDPHMSEYVAEHWKSRSYFSGFTGSAGTLVVTHNKACLWTDSRYSLQAEKQLNGTGIELFIIGENDTPSYSQWLINNLQVNAFISMYEFTFSIDEIISLTNDFSAKKLILETNIDIVSKAWTNRPALPEKEIFIHDIIYAGETVTQKLNKIQAELIKNKTDILLLNMLDEIAWLFNIRGGDIAYNPVVIAYAAIEIDKTTLFISENKITPATQEYLTKNDIVIEDYSSFYTYISSLKNKSILLDKTKMNFAAFNQVVNQNKIVFDSSPITRLKCIKNNREKEGFRDAMIKDGMALTRFFMWLENCLNSNVEITEVSLAKKLKEFRSEQALFYGESFAPIVAYKEHGAIVHYSATHESDIKIEPSGYLLIDSGGQYFNGTTDITRTIGLGNLSPKQKRDFTLVLKGHIALATAEFPAGTYGYQLDSLARSPLLSEGLNYGHGTGHGVGYFLCVHEGPQSIKPDQNKTVLELGMVLSNEPGVYITGEYGIRIENLLLVENVKDSCDNGFLHFEILTLFPIDTDAIDFSIMSKNEIDWLNNYHQLIYDKLSPFLSTIEKNWLKNKCQRINELHV